MLVSKHRISLQTFGRTLLALLVAGGFAFLFYQFSFAQYTPPGCEPPGCQPGTTGGSSLYDALSINANAGRFGKDSDAVNGTGFVSLGGEGGAVRLGVGTTTPGYPLDVIAQNSGDVSKDTAVVRLSYNNNNTKAWTGVKLDRLESGQFKEKWFIGSTSTSDNLVILNNGDANNPLINAPPVSGAACFGAMYVGRTASNTHGNIGGYTAANAACALVYPGSHMCSTEEIMRTITCRPGSVPSSGVGWISNGPPTYTELLANDCQGWTTNSNTTQGTAWVFKSTGGWGKLLTCDKVLIPIVCCR